jgi:hypothetical protein
VLGLATIAAAALISWERIKEKWCVHRLKVSDEAARNAAMEWLLDLGGEAALMPMLEYSCSMGRGAKSDRCLDDIQAMTALDQVRRASTSSARMP